MKKKTKKEVPRKKERLLEGMKKENMLRKFSERKYNFLFIYRGEYKGKKKNVYMRSRKKKARIKRVKEKKQEIKKEKTVVKKDTVCCVFNSGTTD